MAQLRSAVEAASEAVGGHPGGRSRPTLERPRQAGFGDYATNAAMLLAKDVKAAPRDIAVRLGDELSTRLGGALDRVEIAGPGFLNLFLSDAWHASALDHVLAAGDAYGSGGAEEPRRFNVEFVSANPTGPMTAASGRHGAYGDALVRLLQFDGHKVTREYYFNDAGGQVEKLGASICARARGEAIPEGGYEGDYVQELADRIPDAADGDVEAITRRGIELVLESIRVSMEGLRVHFDTWFSERTLHEGDPAPVQRALTLLEQRGESYGSEGALWLRTSAHGDDKDRVLVRSNGRTTYFGADVAYLADKLARGFERLVIPLGADHHGYLGRMRAALATLGEDPERLEMPILQFVHVVEGGERASMSKRRGDFVTLDELLERIGPDAARFLMLQRSHDTTVDLDLELAVAQTAENPVYYVQYAHARIASMRRKAAADAVEEALAGGAGLRHALEPIERELVKKLLAFPDEVAEAVERRAPHRIANYVLELAQVYARFYEQCPVLKASDELRPFRLRASVATQRVVARALDLLGVSAPESM